MVLENELEAASENSMFKAEGNVHEQERDVLKYWKNKQFRIAVYGMENQTRDDYDMPLRVISYDGAEYKKQLLQDKEIGKVNKKNKKKVKKNRYPVVTLVLYLGYNSKWKAPTSLYERLTIDERLRPFVNDYKINLFEIAYLTDEQVSMFKSDFRIVADYLVQMRKNNDYVAPKGVLEHVHEMLYFMSVVTDDKRFEDSVNEFQKGEWGNMCEVLDRIVNRGIEQGLKRGKYVMLTELVCKKLAKDKEISQIACELEEDESTIEDICKIASQYAPEYNIQEIVGKLLGDI